MSITGPVVAVLVICIGVLAIVGVLVFIYWRKRHHVNQRLVDEEGHSFFDRMGLGKPSSTITLTDHYGLVIPSRLAATLFPVCGNFPIQLPKLGAQVHINPVFHNGEWMDEHEHTKLNITKALYHNEVPKDGKVPKANLKSFVEQGVPIYMVHSTDPEQLLDEIKQVLRSMR